MHRSFFLDEGHDDEVVLMLFFLPSEDIANCLKVNSYLNSLINRTSALWKEMYRLDFGLEDECARQDIDWKNMYIHRNTFVQFYVFQHAKLDDRNWIRNLTDKWRRGLSESDKLQLMLRYYEIEGREEFALELESIVKHVRHKKNSTDDYRLYINYIRQGRNWKQYMEKNHYELGSSFSFDMEDDLTSYQHPEIDKQFGKQYIELLIEELDHMFKFCVLENVTGVGSRSLLSDVSIEGPNGKIIYLHLSTVYDITNADFNLFCDYPRMNDLEELNFVAKSPMSIFRRFEEAKFGMNGDYVDSLNDTENLPFVFSKDIFQRMLTHIGYKVMEWEHFARMLQVTLAPSKSGNSVYPFLQSLHRWIKSSGGNLNLYSCIESFLKDDHQP